jgi:hypothetical protein
LLLLEAAQEVRAIMLRVIIPAVAAAEPEGFVLLLVW